MEGEPTGSLRPRHRASFHVALWHVYWALLRPFICMDATVIFCSSGQASGQAYLQSNIDLIMTGAVFCKFPIESSGLLNSHKHEKRTCLRHIEGERIRSETKTIASFSSLVPLYSSTASTPLHPSSRPHPHAAWCATRCLARGIAEGEIYLKRFIILLLRCHYASRLVRANVSTGQLA